MKFNDDLKTRLLASSMFRHNSIRNPNGVGKGFSKKPAIIAVVCVLIVFILLYYLGP